MKNLFKLLSICTVASLYTLADATSTKYIVTVEETATETAQPIKKIELKNEPTSPVRDLVDKDDFIQENTPAPEKFKSPLKKEKNRTAGPVGGMNWIPNPEQ